MSNRMGDMVSVVTAVYNGIRTIGQTIASVQAQDHENWEMIVVDDGSTDGTGEFVASTQDGRLRLIRQENSGRSNARNRGIAAARGDYLLFLDADDWLLTEALSKHVAFLEAEPEYAVSVADGFFCDDDGAEIASFSKRRGEVESGDVLDRIAVDSGLFGAPCAVCLRRSAIEDPQIRFDPELVIGEDWHFFIQIAARAHFGFHESPSCMYRWHEENTMLSASRSYRREQLWLGRKKVLYSPVFRRLSDGIKETFLYQALVYFLPEHPDAQDELMSSDEFRSLPDTSQARLLRLTANEQILGARGISWASAWLERSRGLDGASFKTDFVIKMLGIHPRAAAFLIRFWRLLQDPVRPQNRRDLIAW
jgi:glycosyltransferase involved in cell wall biosynthesis